MARFKISGQLNVVFSDLEVEADSREEALTKLYKMDVDEIIEESYVEECDLQDEEVVLTSGTIHVKVHDVDWDIEDYEVEEAREANPNITKEDIKDSIAKEWFINVDVEDGDDVYNFEQRLTDYLADESGYYFQHYEYDILPEDQPLFDLIKENN